MLRQWVVVIVLVGYLIALCKYQMSIVDINTHMTNDTIVLGNISKPIPVLLIQRDYMINLPNLLCSLKVQG